MESRNRFEIYFDGTFRICLLRFPRLFCCLTAISSLFSRSTVCFPLSSFYSTALDSAQQELSLQLSKGYLQFPQFRNDLRFFLNYIDCHLRQGRLQEAERVTRGTLAQIDHLGSNAQRYLPSVVYRLVRILLVNQAILVPTQVEGRVEMVQLWPIETVAQIVEEMKRFLLNDVSRDSDTLERKLAYLMSIESDRLKATEFAEASGERALIKDSFRGVLCVWRHRSAFDDRRVCKSRTSRTSGFKRTDFPFPIEFGG